jgi:hypothetical protein
MSQREHLAVHMTKNSRRMLVPTEENETRVITDKALDTLYSPGIGKKGRVVDYNHHTRLVHMDFGRSDPMLKFVAKAAKVDVKMWIPIWLTEAVAWVQT